MKRNTFPSFRLVDCCYCDLATGVVAFNLLHLELSISWTFYEPHVNGNANPISTGKKININF